ncbi:hypothetical protein Droror1_Dr00016475 [Drosera rotundifolia]
MDTLRNQTPALGITPTKLQNPKSRGSQIEAIAKKTKESITCPDPKIMKFEKVRAQKHKLEKKISKDLIFDIENNVIHVNNQCPKCNSQFHTTPTLSSMHQLEFIQLDANQSIDNKP